jgi:hypothetical protein
MTIGQRVTVKQAGKLPCEAGDTGTVMEVRNAAWDFPIGVKLDATGHIEWFRESELKPMETDNEG